jgi:hypothetical protein
VHLLLYELKTGLKEVENGDTNKKPALTGAGVYFSTNDCLIFRKTCQGNNDEEFANSLGDSSLGARRDI